MHSDSWFYAFFFFFTKPVPSNMHPPLETSVQKNNPKHYIYVKTKQDVVLGLFAFPPQRPHERKKYINSFVTKLYTITDSTFLAL